MSNRRSAAPKGQERVRSSPVLSAFSFFFRGLVEAPRLDLALAAVSRSETARAAALQCFCFNGLILVSLLAWRWAVAPAVAAAAAAQSYSFPPLLSSLAAAFFAPRAEEDPSSQTPLELTAAFVLAWVFPASAVALSLSGPWCLAVAKGVFEEEGRRRGSSGGSGRGGGGGGGGGRSRSRSRSRAAKRSSSRGATSSPSPTTTTTRRKGSSSSSSSSSSSAAALPAAAASAEAEALELYRGTLFSLLWAQAGLSRLAPLPRRLAFAGPLASTLLTWLLYGLMAFDYRFTAESEKSLSLGDAAANSGEEDAAGANSGDGDAAAAGGESGRKSSSSSARAAVGVADRFAAFGRAWPFYLAFGIVAASPSLVLPFWEGMAAVAALYPLFVARAASGDASAPAARPGAGFVEEEDASSSSSAAAAAAAAAAARRRFSLLSVVFSPAIVLTDLVVSVLTPLAWRAARTAASLLGLSGGGRR